MEMDVAIGKLTLAQINLIYRHLPIDLTFVDENDIVKFYTDTPVRVFSRSAGVIGRKVQNCHPREILPVVNRILDSFKSGEKDTAEFFINKPGKQIFVNYIAVRDENGVYRGCLETNRSPLLSGREAKQTAARKWKRKRRRKRETKEIRWR